MIILRLFVFWPLLLASYWVFAAEKLLVSIDLIRHGERTPIIEIPNSPYLWKEGLGQLTERGQQQAELLGQELAQEYWSSMDMQIMNKDRGEAIKSMRFSSSNRERTIATAKAFIKGIFPAGDTDKIVIKIEDDELLITRPSRNPISIFKLYWWKRKVWKALLREQEAELLHWRTISGLALENFEDLGLFADNLFVRRLHQIPFPQGLSEETANTIIALSDWEMVELFKRAEVSEPMGKRFLEQVDTIFKERKLKHIFYFAHDSSIMAVMTTLGVPLNKAPDYLSRLNFSLFALEDGRQVVRIKFNQKFIKGYPYQKSF
ncbi:MAG: histidine-type phosphatase [Oligoflexia bacterium]|nr:histidine-type phosphatase [Oligoflexia bacterium]